VPLLPALTSPRTVTFLCLFTSQAALLVLSPVLPEIARDFGVSTAAAGQLRAVTGATGGVTALALAVVPRRPGLRELLSLGAICVALGSALSAAAPSLAVLALAQGVVGAGVGLLVAVGIAAAGSWPAPAARAHVLAWAIAGMPAAWILGMPVVGAVAAADWRLACLALPTASALAALAVLRLRPPDAPSAHQGGHVGTWRRPDVARFTLGELLANAAWASVLTYAGALLLGSYAISPAVVALGLGAMAIAMLPGTFRARRRAAAGATRGGLAALTAFQCLAVLALGAWRPAAAITLGLLALMAYVNGRRSMVASALGMESAPEDKVAVMSLRAAANSFGHLLGAAVGGAALALGGFPALGTVLAALFLAAALIHAPPPVRVLAAARAGIAATRGSLAEAAE
jgi:predicted MFS family arabinose efflux permease